VVSSRKAYFQEYLSLMLNPCMLMDSTEALEFAQNKLMPFGKEQKLLEKLEVCSFLSKPL